MSPSSPSHSTKYGLYFARATCTSCRLIMLKRRLYRAYRPHLGQCLRCDAPVQFVKAWWSYYVYHMRMGIARYVQDPDYRG